MKFGSNSKIQKETHIDNIHKIKIDIDGLPNIYFDDEQMSKLHSGLNILVYNNINNRVVDSGYIDRDSGTIICGR